MELIKNNDPRLTALAAYLEQLGKGNATREMYDRYADVLATATAIEVNGALHAVLEKSSDIGAWKMPVSRFIRSVARGLDAETLPSYPAGHFLFRLEAENDEIARFLAELQAASVLAQKEGSSVAGIRLLLAGENLLGAHYVSLQNGLFPLFEGASAAHACVKLMWSLEDDVLALRKRLCGDGGSVGDREFWKLFGDFFVLANSLVYRERRILFPAAFRAVPESLFAAAASGTAAGSAAVPAAGGLAAFASKTGALTQVQLEAIFAVLPLDIAFIGSDDRVKFYSDPPHRIFPRSPAVIGRLVQNCHPPKSVSAVEEILRSFKSGGRDSAEFWLVLHEKFVHIEYFAVRDASGAYLGTLEVSQDATRLRALEGEKRLL